MPEQSTRRFAPSWTVEQIPSDYKVKNANGQALAYVLAKRIIRRAETNPVDRNSLGARHPTHPVLAACEHYELIESPVASPAGLFLEHHERK